MGFFKQTRQQIAFRSGSRNDRDSGACSSNRTPIIQTSVERRPTGRSTRHDPRSTLSHNNNQKSEHARHPKQTWRAQQRSVGKLAEGGLGWGGGKLLGKEVKEWLTVNTGPVHEKNPVHAQGSCVNRSSVSWRVCLAIKPFACLSLSQWLPPTRLFRFRDFLRNVSESGSKHEILCALLLPFPP